VNDQIGANAAHTCDQQQQQRNPDTAAPQTRAGGAAGSRFDLWHGGRFPPDTCRAWRSLERRSAARPGFCCACSGPGKLWHQLFIWPGGNTVQRESTALTKALARDQVCFSTTWALTDRRGVIGGKRWWLISLMLRGYPPTAATDASGPI
jgi:hypothetical protein